jgi:hypothetical protein
MMNFMRTNPEDPPTGLCRRLQRFMKLQNRDNEELLAVADILKELPEDHAARTAFRVGAGILELTRLVDRADLAERLQQAYLDAHERMLRRSGGNFRP